MARGWLDWITFWSFIGLLGSLYALHVESEAHADPGYVATCDVNTWISCSKVFSSKYGKAMSHLGVVAHDSALDLPNALYGAAAYAVFIFVRPLAFKLLPRDVVNMLFLSASIGACLFSLYLAHILLNVLQELCLICSSMYVVNAATLYLSFKAVRADGKRGPPKRKPKYA
jgi:vitamin-K-epoxide reductase (warfarin-sensitive)